MHCGITETIVTTLHHTHGVRTLKRLDNDHRSSFYLLRAHNPNAREFDTCPPVTTWVGRAMQCASHSFNLPGTEYHTLITLFPQLSPTTSLACSYFMIGVRSTNNQIATEAAAREDFDWNAVPFNSKICMVFFTCFLQNCHLRQQSLERRRLKKVF
jgi:hypothetical protein